MNHPTTEALIKRTLSSCDREFYPVHSKWISCVNYTFSPHSNECGIRTLLALSIFALHPNPTEHCLLPYMHHNLAQIGRAWIALAIMNSNIPYTPLHRIISDSVPVADQIVQLSIPASIIPWPSATTIGYLHPSPLKRNQLTSMASKKVPPTASGSNLSSQRPNTSPVTTVPLSFPQIKLKCCSNLNPAAPEFTPASFRHSKNLISNTLPGNQHLSSTLNPSANEFFPKDISPIWKTLGYPTGTSNTQITQVNKNNNNRNDLPVPTSRQYKRNTTTPRQLTLHQFLSSPSPLPYSHSGEMDTWGHVMEDIDTSNTFQILLQNPNGIQPGRTDYDFQYSLMCAYMLWSA
jgi:hypothetical protein